MLRVFAFLQNRLAEPVRRDDRGVTAVEYAILITVVGMALIATLTAFATQLGNFFSGFIRGPLRRRATGRLARRLRRRDGQRGTAREHGRGVGRHPASHASGNRSDRQQAMNRPQSSSRKARDRGSVAVEFALVVPALLLIVFGLIDFGRALNAQISLTGAAREGARLAALGYSNGQVQARVAAAAPSLSGVTVTVAPELPARRRADRRRAGGCQLFVLVHHPDRRGFQLRSGVPVWALRSC